MPAWDKVLYPLFEFIICNGKMLTLCNGHKCVLTLIGRKPGILVVGLNHEGDMT